MRASVYKTYLLIVLMVIFAFNYVDRFALGLLLQDIKVDLGLSDTQLGLLTGIAFAAFYSVLGVPLARWADRGNRVTIITFTTALWSIALAMFGLAGSFLQLLLIRIGVAVGEAGCVPPAHSLIADHFTRAERPRAIAIYMLGIPLAAVAGYFLAGWLNARYGWRITFILVGLPGIAMAALAWLTLKEPRRSQSGFRTVIAVDSSNETDTSHPRLREVVAALWANVTFRHLTICWSLVSFFGYGTWQWKPAFFIRTYGLETNEVGTWFAMIYGICSFLGLYWGGALSARYAANNERLQFKVIAAAYCIFGMVQAGMFVSPNRHLAFALLAVCTVGIYTAHGPLFAAIQSLAPSRMRATAVAIVYLCANLIGMGLGPLAAGALSDALVPRFGAESLRYALLILCSGYLWTAWHLWRASLSVKRDIEVANRPEQT